MHQLSEEHLRVSDMAVPEEAVLPGVGLLPWSHTKPLEGCDPGCMCCALRKEAQAPEVGGHAWAPQLVVLAVVESDSPTHKESALASPAAAAQPGNVWPLDVLQASS